MSYKLGSRLSLQVARANAPAQASSLTQIFKRTAAASTHLERVRNETQKEEERYALSRNLSRNWKAGDVYAPHDLSGAEARKWKKRHRPTTDPFDALSINPLTLYKNFSIMSEYMTEMGRIRHSKSTGLRPVNQRKISKAIRRAIALGLMPSVHKHPEILKKDSELQKLGIR
ncbi:ribosomal protein S18 [Exophiala sideris]|uniref:Small ribosomal subunit protein bS18m n=1 Tax=Exophiala sideris TaxID=1016849 RepID=A0A0D1W396_9EURO|nr:ribosomal protein S18 [Exophiala sideris]